MKPELFKLFQDQCAKGTVDFDLMLPAPTQIKKAGTDSHSRKISVANLSHDSMVKGRPS